MWRIVHDLDGKTEELHIYLPDEAYNLSRIKDNGEYTEELNWTYDNIPQNTPDTTYPHYNGPGPCLKKYIDKKFNTLLDACGTANALTYKLKKRFTNNSNAYIFNQGVGNKFYVSDWKSITVEHGSHTGG